MQIYDIECHHTTGGFDVRVVDIAAMEHYSKPHVIEKKKSARAASNASG